MGDGDTPGLFHPKMSLGCPRASREQGGMQDGPQQIRKTGRKVTGDFTEASGAELEIWIGSWAGVAGGSYKLLGWRSVKCVPGIHEGLCSIPGIIEIKQGTGVMAQWVKELAARPGDLSLILRTPMVEETQFMQTTL